VPVLVLIVVAVALAGGVLVGYLLGNRRRKPVVAASEPTISPAPALSATVIDALSTGVVVLDRDERVRLVNPAARGMGVLTGDRLDVSELIDLPAPPRPRSGCRRVDWVGNRSPSPRLPFRCATRPSRRESVRWLSYSTTSPKRTGSRRCAGISSPMCRTS
jgi:PAS domain-containing protein